MLNKRIMKNNSHGFSLVEMVVAMAILSIFMPVIVGLMKVSVQASDTAETITSNNMNSSMIASVMEKDFKDASAVKVMNEAGTHVKLRASSGICKDWKIDESSHELLSKSNSEGAVVDNAEGWTVLHDKVSAPKPDENNNISRPAFTYSGGTLVYDLVVGADEEKEEDNSKTINDSITSVVAQASHGKCWN